MANGLFAQFGLDVEILEPAPGPANVARVASGATEFCLTSVSHFMKAQRLKVQKEESLPARFVGIVVQRSPMAAMVAADSEWHDVSQLSRGRLGGEPASELVAQFQAALTSRGLEPSPLVPVPYSDSASGPRREHR